MAIASVASSAVTVTPSGAPAVAELAKGARLKCVAEPLSNVRSSNSSKNRRRGHFFHGSSRRFASRGAAYARDTRRRSQGNDRIGILLFGVSPAHAGRCAAREVQDDPVSAENKQRLFRRET